MPNYGIIPPANDLLCTCIDRSGGLPPGLYRPYADK